MCRDCKYWLSAERYDAHGITVAPCALKPDKFVRDRRIAGGLILQAYAMQDDYECASFDAKVAP